MSHQSESKFDFWPGVWVPQKKKRAPHSRLNTARCDSQRLRLESWRIRTEASYSETWSWSPQLLSSRYRARSLRRVCNLTGRIWSRRRGAAAETGWRLRERQQALDNLLRRMCDRASQKDDTTTPRCDAAKSDQREKHSRLASKRIA